MNRRDAEAEGLVSINDNVYHNFWGGDKEKLKEVIKSYRKKYNVRIILVSTQTSGGYHRSFRNQAYAEPILIDYLVLEQVEERKKKLAEERIRLAEERIRLEEEYRIKLEDLEKRHKDLFEETMVARSNINKREEENE